MTEESSGSFSNFWHRSVDKLPPKTVKFMPNVTKLNNGKPGEDDDSSNLTPKQRRRAQVRKAQIEHRQRKENYVKHLEQDVIDLREMIATAETQSALLQHENLAIRNTLSKVNIPLPITGTATSSKGKSPGQGQQLVSSLESFPFQQDTQPGTTDTTLGPKQVLQWPSRSPSNETLVSTHFDELIDASCLQIGQPGNFNYENDITMNSPDIFNFPNTTFTAPEPTPAPATNFSRPNPAPPDQVAAIRPADLTTIAINFILALEHPCRTHFHANSSTFDPKGDHSGHELMASTFLYSHAPEPIFSNLDNAKWTMPSLELTQLHAMSQSLPKGDWEITPVQAWFMLAEKVGVGRVLGGGGTVIGKLKKGLGKLVGCFEFGAVMDEGKFWEVVGSVIGGEEEEG